MLFIRRSSSLGRKSGRSAAFLFLTALSGLALSQPAFAANITVASPVNGTTVPSPVWIRAHNIGCDGLTPTAFGFSIDSSSTLTKGVTVNDIDVTIGMAAGSHTIHFKSWTSNGVCPVVSTTLKSPAVARVAVRAATLPEAARLPLATQSMRFLPMPFHPLILTVRVVGQPNMIAGHLAHRRDRWYIRRAPPRMTTPRSSI